MLIGSFPSLPGFAAVAAFGVILAAIYLLWAYERVFTGVPDKPENQQLTDLNAREIGLMVPLVVLMLVLGMYPKILEQASTYEVPEPGRLSDVFAGVVEGDE